MKHQTSRQEQKLTHWLLSAGIPVEPTAVALIVRHAEWLLETNKSLNLTSLSDPEDILRLHALDSLLVLPEVRSAGSGLIVDIGSGGGFPGLPLGAALGRTTLLVDSVKKKADALRRFTLQENLESWVSVSGERSEALARLQGAVADCVVARAVAELPALVELAAPLLRPQGVLVALKGQPDAEELRRGEVAARRCGLVVSADRAYELPDGGERRRVITYLKTGEPEVELPRREGMATKRPLA
ncbi:MAG: 16S rRNA (guanine(527)-N(7))-methyltransferase RsmG [Coriobacteriia bacterium]|nr:16S rRNA (guanine(527)-N(7))-methyltransferase RsmG [Coriobacteriia bacterium]